MEESLKRYLTLGALLIAFAIGACIHNIPSMPTMPGVIVLEAQTLPITKTLVWGDSDVSVTGYSVTLDGTVIGTPTTQSQAVTFTTLGNHTLTVTAVNLFWQTASAPLVVQVQVPTAPNALKIQ